MKRKIILIILGIFIVIIATMNIAFAYLDSNLEGENKTNISLRTCAKVSFKENSQAINLENTYPMGKEIALEKVKPYEFSITSTCDEGITYSVYLGILKNNSMGKENIRYGIKLKKADNFVKEGKLSELENIQESFNNEEKQEITTKIGETKEIVVIMEAAVKKGEEKEYQLYLWVDEEAGNETMGKTFQTGVFVKGTKEYDAEKEQYLTLAEYIKGLYTKDGENNLYYHDGLGEYENASLEAGDYSYRYAGGDYHITQQSLDKGYKSIYDVIPLKLDDGTVHKNNYWWVSTDINRYLYLDYNVQTQFRDSSGLGKLLNQAISDGYIEKNEVHNYVCFGSSESDCPKENLYRIIGVYEISSGKQVKLVKAGNANKDQLGDDGSFFASWDHYRTYIGDSTYRKDVYYWDKDGANKQANWENSSLNTVNLNAHFINYLTGLEDGKWILKIADITWQVGGMTSQNGHTQGAKIAYDYELGDKKNLVLTEPKKIGLMYISDYYYAASEEYWPLMGYDNSKQDVSITENTDYRGAIWDNWLWFGDSEWLITPRNEYLSSSSFTVNSLGDVHTSNVAKELLAIRPCFYLNSNVNYVSGDGSLNSPFIIK